VVAALSMMTLTSCRSSSSAIAPQAPDHLVVIDSPGEQERLAVRVADTDAERATGLMGVVSLPADQGMAFAFAAPTQARFWMKDTSIPLSIAFVDQRGRVVTIEEMEPCRADPCPTFSATSPYTLAVEANRGWFARAGVTVGDRASLEPTSS
jgi:uncharacterized membrane protein (UPF0127 family)